MNVKSKAYIYLLIILIVVTVQKIIESGFL